MEWTFLHDNRTIVVGATTESDGLRIELPDGSSHVVTVYHDVENLLRIGERRRTFEVAIAWSARQVEISYEGRTYAFVRGAGGVAERGSRASGALTAPMPGVVVDVKVAEGDRVQAYQPVAIVEAMKVMATVEAPFAGTVRRVHVERGRQVPQGELLIEIAPSEASPESKT